MRASLALLAIAACANPPARPPQAAPPAPARVHVAHQALVIDLTEPRILVGRARLLVQNSGGTLARHVPLYLTPFARLGEVRAGGRILSTRLVPAPRHHEVFLQLSPGTEVPLEVHWSIDLTDYNIRARLGEAISLEPGARVIELALWHPRLLPPAIPEKPPYRLEVRAPKDETVIAPGHLQGTVAEGHANRTVFEAEVGPASLQIVTGRYEATLLRAHGITVEVLRPPSARLPEERLRAVADLLARGLALYEDLFGPAWTRPIVLRLATAPLRGARALPFAILLGDGGDYLAGDLHSRTENGNRRDAVLLHELAHLWWGHLVTATASEAALLHEGLAEFSMLLALERLRGSEAALEVRRELRARALRPGPAVLGLSLGVRGAARYAQDRGALLFETLRARIGEEPLRTALAEVVRLFRGGTLMFAALAGALAQSRDGAAARRLLELAAAPELPRVRVTLGRLENMPDGTFVRVRVENLSRQWAYVPISLEYSGRTSEAAADLPPEAEEVLRFPVSGTMTVAPRFVVDPQARSLVSVAPSR